jgi:hypothetical protein
VGQTEQCSVQRRSQVVLDVSTEFRANNFLWYRHLLLAEIAKDTEYSVHAMSATESGYRQRAEAKLRAIKLIERKEGLWLTDPAHHNEDEEEAIEIIGSLRSICTRWRKLGKRRAP